MIVLFDLDNTIASMDHRLHLLDNDPVDWDAFEAECVNDTPIESTIEILNALHEEGHQCWVWTGRSDGVREQTVKWLADNGVEYYQLLMRPHGLDIPTTELKKRWLDDDPVPRRKVLCAFDDDPRIIKMLRKEGVTSYQVVRPEDETLVP